MGLLVLLSIIGVINGWAMAAPRIYFAQPRDCLFFRRFAILNTVAPGFVVNTFSATPGPAITGTLLIAAGVPVYFIWNRKG